MSGIGSLVATVDRWARIGDYVRLRGGEVCRVSRVNLQSSSSATIRVDGHLEDMEISRDMYDVVLFTRVEDTENALVRDARVQEALLIGQLYMIGDMSTLPARAIMQTLCAVQNALANKGARVIALDFNKLHVTSCAGDVK
jgi:hypothetical protein